MTDDRLLTEIERQEKYLERLPSDYSFPLFNSKQALESQRRSGYRTTAAAAREIVDNALEAGAKKIEVILDKSKKNGGVSAMAFIDNGSGMVPKMVRYALSWGGGTHFDDPTYIGKFGFGLPNASINQTRRVEVYTKTERSPTIVRAALDINRVRDFGLHSIEPEEESQLPDFVQRHFAIEKRAFNHGTVVVWVNPDRLTYSMPATLKEHLVDDFGVTYRYLLESVELIVEGVRVKPTDPLFLDPKGRLHLDKENDPPQEAVLITERTIPIKYHHDPETGETVFAQVTEDDPVDLSDPTLVASGALQLRVSKLPLDYCRSPKTGQKTTTDAHKRFDIRKSRRGMSFVRAGREIETVDAFPKSSRDISSGMGKWPLLQSYAYYWGIEARFSPDFDEVFGITNDKQTVRPSEEFWRLLTKLEIDKLAMRVNREVTLERSAAANAQKTAQPSAAETAAATADAMDSKAAKVPDRSKEEVQEEFSRSAEEEAKKTGRQAEEVKKAMSEEAKRRPYVIDYFDDERGPFYEPVWQNGDQLVIRVNRKHTFYQVLYGDLLRQRGTNRALEAVNLLLITLARSEMLTENATTTAWYRSQREENWTPFLRNALAILQDLMRTSEEPDVEEQVSEAVA